MAKGEALPPEDACCGSGRDEVRWAPRVSKDKIRRLYQSHAGGLLDEELLDDVGITLYLRCEAIVAVAEALRGRVLCPRCAATGTTTVIERALNKGARDGLMTCPACGWACTWADYQRTFKRRQLNLGGAEPAFTTFLTRYPKARTPTAKLLAIDRLIHEFHYSLREQPDLPTRAAGVNLIKGRLTDVVEFLDELTYDGELKPQLTAQRERWRRELHRSRTWCGDRAKD